MEWIDVFSRRAYVDIIPDSLKFCIEQKQLKLFAWCIITNHLHLIAQSSKGDLSATFKRLQEIYFPTITEAIAQNKEESRRNWIAMDF